MSNTIEKYGPAMNRLSKSLLKNKILNRQKRMSILNK